MGSQPLDLGGWLDMQSPLAILRSPLDEHHRSLVEHPARGIGPLFSMVR